MNTTIKLKLSAQRALLFNIIDAVELFFISLEGDKLTFNIFCSRDLSPEEQDIYFAVSGEISGDFLEVHNSDVYFHLKDDFKDNFEKYGQLVFAKHEG